MPIACSTRSVRPARRPRGCGSSCATRRTPSSCTRRMRRAAGYRPRGSRAKASPGRGTSSKARKAADIAEVTTHVHQAALDVLGPVTDPATVHQSKFSMGTVLALVARFGHAGLTEFEQHFHDDETVRFRDRVRMVLDDEVDAA